MREAILQGAMKRAFLDETEIIRDSKKPVAIAADTLDVIHDLRYLNIFEISI